MATAPKAPVWSNFFGGADVPNYGLSNFTYMLSQSDLPQNQAKINEVVSKVGSIDKYLQGIKNYEAAYQDYLLEHAKYVSKDYYGQELPQDRVDFYTQQKEDVVAQAQKQLDAAKRTQIGAAQESRNLRDARYTNLRNELETQYNNLQRADSRFGYAGRNSDLPTVFNQQAAQLADAGVMSIADLRIQDGRLYDAANRRVVTNSNLGGQVYTDRDTGVQKWGDIFTGVKGGANYGIMEAPDGSVLLFPAWEKTKSPIAQVGLGGLESFITPLLTVGGAFIGAGPAGSVAGAALGAGAGSTAGQLLASGEIDWEKVALSAGGAAAGQAIFGPGLAEAPAAAEAGATAATSTAVPGSFQAVLPELGVQTAATTAGATVVPGSFAAALPGLLAPVNVAGSLPLEVGQTFTPAPGSFQEALPGLGVETQASAGGFTAAPGSFQAALPSLGVAAFPSVAMNPIIDGASALPAIDTGAVGTAATTAGGLSTAEAVLATSALAGGAKQQPQAYRSGYGGGGQVAGVDASGLLALLQGRAGVPGVSSLIAPVVNPMTQPQSLLNVQVPQYQPLTSLLG